MTQKIFLPFEPAITVVDFARKGTFVVVVVVVFIIIIAVVVIGPFCSHKSVFKGCGYWVSLVVLVLVPLLVGNEVWIFHWLIQLSVPRVHVLVLA